MVLKNPSEENHCGNNPSDSPDLSILLTDDSEIAELNSKFRNKDKATDVLSFSMTEGESGGVEAWSLGDVIISLETAEAQARELEVSLADEILRLLVHGVLHLVGFEHEGVEVERVKEMEEKEQEMFELVVEGLGIG